MTLYFTHESRQTLTPSSDAVLHMSHSYDMSRIECKWKNPSFASLAFDWAHMKYCVCLCFKFAGFQTNNYTAYDRFCEAKSDQEWPNGNDWIYHKTALPYNNMQSAVFRLHAKNFLSNISIIIKRKCLLLVDILLLKLTFFTKYGHLLKFW